MADGIFDIGRKFSESLIVTVGLEYRVVTETAVAARSKGNGSFHSAFKGFQYFAVECDRYRADEAGAAVFFAFEFASKFGTAFAVRCRIAEETGRIRVFPAVPLRAVTPGQAAVFYNGNRLLGGGVIENVD